MPLWRWLLAIGTSTAAITTLTGAIALTASGTWLGMRWILDPASTARNADWLPDWVPVAEPADPFQSLAEIRARTAADGQVAGEPLPLGDSGALLIPARSPADRCAQEVDRCDRIAALRVYRPADAPLAGEGDRAYALVTELEVEGPQESFVLAPLVAAGAPAQGANRPLPLERVEPLNAGAPGGSGFWFVLDGTYDRDGRYTRYGKVFHYNPERDFLHEMTAWHSPSHKLPFWKNLAGDATPELAVDRAVGLNPQFDLYSVVPYSFAPDPIQLRPIVLNEPVLAEPAYQDAIALVRSGLWSDAVVRLEELKLAAQVMPELWSDAAQIQLDAIRFHALAAQAQADAAQPSVAQQTLVELLDGRWARALERFDGDRGNRAAIVQALQADRGQVWRRVETALEVTPDLEAAKLWGVALLAAQDGRPAAIAWYRQQQGNSPALDARVDALLETVAEVRPEPTAAP